MSLEQGESIAFYLADALYHLGFPWNKVGEEGLKITERFSEHGDDIDQGTIDGMRRYFEMIRQKPPDIPPMTFETFLGPSEYRVVDQLLSSLEDIGGGLPWVATPIYDILNDYDEHLESIKASKDLKQRSGRLRHSISDLEDHAAGRG